MAEKELNTNVPEDRSMQEQPAPATIWLVDDNEQYCIVFKAATQNSPDIRCTQTFDDGTVMLDTLVAEPEWPSVILLDINMPT
ncbi:MAG TPA: hypothetical protein VMU30_00600, partial [Bacteroidota bacterium]|nr:hypothetical protein [Bacteroidota bacterium]